MVARAEAAPSSRPLTRADAWIAPAVGLAALGLYLRTLYPGLLPGDGGEFQALAYLLSDSHPTGYPVYLLLARLFAFLPVGEAAYRINLFSAVMGALTVACVYLAGRVLSGSRWAGLLGAGALAVSSSFWSQAVIAEVYTPGTAFLAGVILFAALWQAERRPIHLLLAGLLGGLSLGVHLSVALAAPAVGTLLLTHHPRWRSLWLPASAGVLAGLALWVGAFLLVDLNQGYANYFNSSIVPSRTAWNFSEGALDSPFERLWFGLSAKQFQPFMFADPARVMPAQWQAQREQIRQEFSAAALALAALGLVGLLARSWRMGLFLILALAGQLAFTLNYQIWDLYVFLIPGYVIIAVLVCAGAGVLFALLGRLPRVWGAGLAPLLWLGLAALSAQPFLSSRLDWLRQGEVAIPYESYPSHGDSTPFHQDIAGVVSALEPGSIVFTHWGRLYPYYYVAQVEQGRADLYFIDPMPRDDYLHISDSTLDLIDRHPQEKQIYFERNIDEVPQAGYMLKPVPIGGHIFYQVIR